MNPIRNVYNTLINAILQTNVDAVKLRCLGGRYVEVGDKHMTLNEIVKSFTAWSVENSGIEYYFEKKRLLEKIREIDVCHPETHVDTPRWLTWLTWIKQFFGNLFYDRNKELESIEESLKKQASAVFTPPAPKLLPSNTEITPENQFSLPPTTSSASSSSPRAGDIASPIPVHKGPLSFLIKTKEEEAQEVKPTKAEKTESPPPQPPPESEIQIHVTEPEKSKENLSPLREHLGKGQAPASPSGSLLKHPFPTASDASPPTKRSVSVSKYKSWDETRPLSITLSGYFFPLTGVLFHDVVENIIALNDCSPELSKKVRTKVGLKHESDDPEYLQIVNSSITIRYVKDVLILVKDNSVKTMIFETFGRQFTISSLNTLLKEYSSALQAKKEPYNFQDVTLSKIMDGYVIFIRAKKEGHQKELLIQGYCETMNTCESVGVSWVGGQIATLHGLGFLDTKDICELFDEFKKRYPGRLNSEHNTYKALSKLLPDEVREEEAKKDLAKQELIRQASPQRTPWVPLSQRTTPEKTSPTPVRGESTPTKQGPPVELKPPEPTTKQQIHIDEYKIAEPSTIALLQKWDLIDRLVTFGQTMAPSGGSPMPHGRSKLAPPSLNGRQKTVETSIRLITQKYEIDPNDDLTIRIIGDVLAFGLNQGNGKGNMLRAWLPEMNFKSINALIRNYWLVISEEHKDALPSAEETPKLIFQVLLNLRRFKGLDKSLALPLLKHLIAQTKDVNWMGSLFSYLSDAQVIDKDDIKEFKELCKQHHPTTYPTLSGYQDLERLDDA